MANLEELRTRLAYIADSDQPLVRIELAPIEAAELLEALPDPDDGDVAIEDELAVLGDLVAVFDRIDDDPATVERVIHYITDRYA